MVIRIQKFLFMVDCPNCGNKFEASPDRKLENAHFSLASYTCPKCRSRFRKVSC